MIFMNSKTRSYLYILIITLVATIGTVILLGQILQMNTEESVGYLTEKLNLKSSVETSDIASWQTYRNEEYGFEIKYPRNLEIQENRQIGSVSFWDPEYKDALVPPVLTIAVYKLDPKYDSLQVGSQRDMLLSVAKNELRQNFDKVRRYKGDEIIVDSTDAHGTHSFFYEFNTYTVAHILGRDAADTKESFYDQILSTFKFVDSTVNTGSLLKTCPEEWIQNDMPVITGTPEDRQYYILDGKRRELKEFDRQWVGENCNIEKQIVY